MPIGTRTRSRLLLLGVTLGLGLAIGLRAVPASAGDTDAAVDSRISLNVYANVPHDAMDQSCVAYANVYNGTPPYTYQWSGTWFSGTGQTSEAYISGAGTVTLEVWDSNLAYGTDSWTFTGSEEGSDFCDA